jgi:hypothetical protein
MRHDCGYDSEKNDIRPRLTRYWKIPPDASAEFVAPMEDVLEVCQRPLDPETPLICVDESSKQLVGHVFEPVPAGPGHPELVDPEYVRKGVAEIFMAVEPLTGKRHVEVTERRTRKDWAGFVRKLVDEIYPAAKKIVLVMDNLNTHNEASLYAAFPPEEARRLAERLEIHHTPKHGSWLNIAEIELSVLKRQCLDRRIASIGEMRTEVAAWEAERNRRSAPVDWQFTSTEARVKLKRLYPKI